METNEKLKDAGQSGETVNQPDPAQPSPEQVSAAPETNAETTKNEVKEKKPVLDKKTLTVAQKKKREVMRWVLLNFGILMMAASVYFFQTPNNFTLGGVAGIAIILARYFLTQGTIMLIINVALLILGLIILGKQCTFRTIYCSLMYTGIIWGCERINLIELCTGGQTTLTNQPFMELCYAVLLFGIGGAIVFNCGASSGGTDIIALIVKKFSKMNVGMALMIVDMIVVCVSFFAFADIQTLLYSALGLFAKSFLLDGVIESIGKTKYITIITNNTNDIANYIISVINHSFTVYDAEGGYTGEPKKVMVTVCKRSEALRLKAKVKQIDPSAFVIITDANEILGKGFGETF